MARLRFIAEGHEGHTCRVFGGVFPHGEWTEIKGMDPAHVETLSLNPTFEVEAAKPAPKAPAKPAEAA